MTQDQHGRETKQEVEKRFRVYFCVGGRQGVQPSYLGDGRRRKRGAVESCIDANPVAYCNLGAMNECVSRGLPLPAQRR